MTCKEIDSTADKAVEVSNSDILLLFQDAVFCMFSTMAEPKWKNGVLPSLAVRVRVEAADIEALLVDFLNEVLYLHEEYRLYPFLVAVHELASVGMPEESDLFVDTTIVFADSMEPFGSAIKAVTYHDLSVEWAVDGEPSTARLTFDV